MSNQILQLKHSDFAIVSGRMNKPLVESIAGYLKVQPHFFDTANWGNGYPRCVRPDNVTFKGKTVFIITSIQYNKVGSPVEELEMIYNSCGNAREIYVLLSWFCTKDDVDHSDGHDPNAVMIAKRVANLAPKTIYTFDLHQSSHLGYFSPAYRRRFYLLSLLIEQAKKMGIDQVAATDWSSSKRATKVESFLKTGNPIVLAKKEHDHSQQDTWSEHSLHGKIIGKKIGMFDDMALSLGTIKKACQALSEMGESEVHAFSPHFDPTPVKTFNNLKEAFENNWLTSFTTTNSTEIPEEFLKFGPEKFRVIDAAPYIGQLIASVVNGESSSPYFQDI